MTYDKLIERLFVINRDKGVKFGLSNALRLNKALDYPDRSYHCIHIAGTNGKGSVAAKIAKGLESQGHCVGLFTSPHISCFRERIQINGEMIPEQDVVKHLSLLFSLNVPATFFELTTLMALKYFADEKVDYAVVETGLGGRLDATNIVTPKLAVITTIDLDHTEILGNTLEKIAQEKAGIIKPGIPVVIGPRVTHISHIHHENIIQVEGSYNNFEEENRAIAKRALELLKVSPHQIEKGLLTSLPCRMEILKPNVILDVAHNPAALKCLFRFIHQRFPGLSIRVVFGLSNNKDVDSCLEILQKNCYYLYPVEAPNGRGIPLGTLLQKGVKTVKKTIRECVKHAYIEADPKKEIILVCGSFFIMNEARAALGIEEPQDFIDLNERRL